MKRQLKKAGLLLCSSVLLAGMFTGCGGSSNGTSSTTDGVASSGGTSEEKNFNLKLGHGLAEDHAVHIALTEFASKVKEESGGSLSITILPNGILGGESDMLGQIQTGALDLAKVSASAMGNFSPQYNAYSVPYVFDNKEHYYSVMDSDITKNVFETAKGDGILGLTWLDSGARSFYTVKTPIRKPEDLKGLKIRTMDSEMAIKMMELLGGSSVVMGYGEVYPGLQQGVIDGAENNVTALRDHGEVAKYYSTNEHTRIPDIITISSKIWDEMSNNQREILQRCADETSEQYKQTWADFEQQVLADVVQRAGVEVISDVDRKAFQDAVQPIYDDLKQNKPDVYAVVEEIRSMAK